MLGIYGLTGKRPIKERSLENYSRIQLFSYYGIQLTAHIQLILGEKLEEMKEERAVAHNEFLARKPGFCTTTKTNMIENREIYILVYGYCHY